jgi:PTH1 family peptidyl-tRNA hydrolase
MGIGFLNLSLYFCIQINKLKYLIVGLGNIGAEYKNTRHNIGFDVADQLVSELKGEFKVDKLASVAKVKYKGRNLVVIKPTTYMNLSGKAVKYWLEKEKIHIERLLVVVDDIALEMGGLRLKTKGGDAGHNGLTDIIIKLNTTSFPRLRFGIGNDFPRGYQSDYVLGKWSNKDIDLLLPRVDNAVEMIKSFVSIGPGLTMTNFNNK